MQRAPTPPVLSHARATPVTLEMVRTAKTLMNAISTTHAQQTRTAITQWDLFIVSVIVVLLVPTCTTALHAQQANTKTVRAVQIVQIVQKTLIRPSQPHRP